MSYKTLDLRWEIAKCNNCPLKAKQEARFVPFEVCGSYSDIDTVFILEAPGKTEIEFERPIHPDARAGGVFRQALTDLGIRNYAVGNVVCCRPYEFNNPSRDRKPTEEERSYCKNHVIRLINKIQPKYVILLGDSAIKAILPKKYTLDKNNNEYKVGYFVNKSWIDIDGIKYGAVYHPSYIARNGGVKSEVYANKFFGRLKELLIDNSDEINCNKLDLKYTIKHIKELPKVMDEYMQYTDIAFDYETTGVNTFSNNLRIVGLGLSTTNTWPHSAVYLHWPKDYIMSDAEKAKFINFLEIKKPWTYSAKFEMNVTWNIFKKLVYLNDSFCLCKMSGRPINLKDNARFFLKIDHDWEEVFKKVLDIADDINSIKSKLKEQDLNLLLSNYKQYIETINNKKKLLKRERLLLEHIDYLENLTKDSSKLQEILSQDIIYSVESIPIEVIGKYCCYDAYYTIQLKNKLYNKHEKQYEIYIKQTWLAAILEAYGLSWNDEKAKELDNFYTIEACSCLSQLIQFLDILDEKKLEAVSINSIDSLPNDEKLDKLKAIFNPLSNKKECQEPFWSKYKSNKIVALITLEHIVKEINNLPDFVSEKLIECIERTNVEKTIESIIEKAKSIKTTFYREKVFDIIQSLGYIWEKWFSGFSIEVLEFNYNAWKNYGNIDVDNRDTWSSEFESLYLLKRFKKIMKAKTTYIAGKVGRKNVFSMIVEELILPPTRSSDYYLTNTSDDKYILNTSFFENSAQTRRWKSGNHCLEGNTKILLATGESMSIEQLYGDKNYKGLPIISYNNKKNIQIISYIDDLILSGYTDELVEVILNNGKSFKCTPNHRLLMKNGDYIEVQNIRHDTELTPVDYSCIYNYEVFQKENPSILTVNSLQIRAKIKKIKLEKPVPVYDLVINKQTPCFSLESGIISHNTIPAESELLEIYTTRLDNNIIVHSDYKTHEIVVLASIANDVNLLKALKDGKDIHKYVASMIFNKPEESVTKDERRIAKSGTFGSVYGETPESFALKNMNGDIAKSKEFFNNLFTAFPNIRKYIDNAHKSIKENGFVTTLFGDRIYVDTSMGLNRALRKGQNFGIQSSASTLAALGIFKLWETVQKLKISAIPTCFTHDSSDWEVDVRQLLPFLSILKASKVKYIRDKYSVPVNIDYEIGLNQGQMISLSNEIKERNKIQYSFKCEKSIFFNTLDILKKSYDIEYTIEEEKEEYQSLSDLFLPKRAFSRYLGSTQVFISGIIIFNLS